MMRATLTHWLMCLRCAVHGHQWKYVGVLAKRDAMVYRRYWACQHCGQETDHPEVPYA